jgi:hypothetical protein
MIIHRITWCAWRELLVRQAGDLFEVLSLYGKIYCAEQGANEGAIPSRK